MQDMARGALEAVGQGVARAKNDLGAAVLKEIDVRHHKKLVELKTTEMAVSDLDKYHKARPSSRALNGLSYLSRFPPTLWWLHVQLRMPAAMTNAFHRAEHALLAQRAPHAIRGAYCSAS